MTRNFGPAPDLDEFEAMARAAWEALPQAFRALAGDVLIRIEDFPADENLGEGDDPFALTGLYVGADLTQRSIQAPQTMPSMVLLFRRPILDEWAERGDVDLELLVAHVLVHEIGHHFGLSDAAIDALLDAED